MPYIRVVYKTNKFDYVSSDLLDFLITTEKITQFDRPSEERWVTLGVDPIRKAEVTNRVPERRRPICNDIICPGPSSGSH